MVGEQKLKSPANKKDISKLTQKEQDRIMRKRAADLKYRRERRRLDKLERDQKPPEKWTRKGPEQEKKKKTALKKAKNVVVKKAKKATKNLLKTLRGVVNEDKRDERKKKKELSELHKEARRLDRKWKKEIKEEEEKREETEYEIIEIRSNSSTKFQTWFEKYMVKIKNVFRDPSDIFLDCIKKSVEKHDIQPGDKVRLIINHNDWFKPFSTKLITVPKGELTRKLIERAIMFAEYKAVPIDELIIEVQTTKIPRGAGIKPKTKTNIKDGKKRSVIQIKNNDSICLARAIVTVHAKNNPEEWTKSEIKDGFCKSRKLQKTEALKLHRVADVPIYDNGNTYEDCDTFANHLGVCIRIFSGDDDSFEITKPVYTAEPEDPITKMRDDQQYINLYKTNEHYDVIISMTAFTGYDYYCDYCKKPYTRRDKHKCPQKCDQCCSYDCPKDYNQNKIHCEVCNREFLGQFCYNEHKRDRRKRVKDPKKGTPDTVCISVQKCPKCKVNTGNLAFHKCGYSTCSNCKNYVDAKTHMCYMIPEQTKGGSCTRLIENNGDRCSDIEKYPRNRWCKCCQTRTDKYLFVDFKAKQEKDYTEGYKKSYDTKKKLHEVNFACTEDPYGNTKTYKTVDDFCTDIILNEKYKGFTILAHNGGPYDFKFIQAWLIKNGITPSIISNGTKIVYMKLPRPLNTRFVDTIKLIPGKLADFPKTFGLEEKKKGYFPHYFSIENHKNYVGPIPARKYYGPGYMKPGERKKFIKWHKERVKENYVFDFKKEMQDYCASDVNILAAGCKQFRKDFLEIGNLDPFQYITIAEICMNLYRNKFMPKNTIAIVNDVKEETYSEESIKWLKYINPNIQHALNGGEFYIPDIGKVDGYCSETNTVYEFQGCFWHGCKKCYRDRNLLNPISCTEMDDLRTKTSQKNNKIRGAGHNLVEMWECDLANDTEYIEWKKNNNINIVTPLNPREAFFGGRTNVTKMMHEFKPGERGMYKDYCSLYPTTNLKKEYPVGHPEKITNPPQQYNHKWFGLVKCEILPPRGLYHPVLPVKTKCGNAEKLLFPLCRTCSKHQSQETCNHTAEERSLLGTWCTPELELAMEKGYKIQKIHQVWHFKETTKNLFGDYVRTFMKIKMESSHPPEVGPNCTYKSLEDFREQVWKKDGIKLGEIKYNPGKRQLAKLCLNSLWGKFGQRTNMSKDLYTSSCKQFHEIVLDDRLEDVNMSFINDEIVRLDYKIKDKFNDNKNKVNIFVAEFTTSHARCTLYELLDKLGERVLAYDTDSAWYLLEKGEDDPIPTGDMLGELTDELRGGHIVDWVGTGPKSYSYKSAGGVDGNQNVCKIKGFTLNFNTSQKINMESMKDIVRGDVKEIVTERDNITRDDRTLDVITERQQKKFTLCYDKRVILSNYDTIPYGY